MMKNDFESTNSANFEEVVHNFDEKMLIFNICRHGLMPNLIEKSWTVSREYGVHVSNFANFRIALSYADSNTISLKLICYRARTTGTQ